MITLKDLEAFCDADSKLLVEIAARERLNIVQAYARAHEAAQTHCNRSSGTYFGIDISIERRDLDAC